MDRSKTQAQLQTISSPLPSTEVPQHDVSQRADIDGLRALAVAAVVINHFQKNLLPAGYLGVDCFFVISGFVITSSLARRPSRNFSDFFLGFYVRRIKRLVPALVLCVLATSVLICLFQPNPLLSLETGITSLVGLSNLYLYRRSTDYFAASTEMNAFTQTWSLGIEEQFYLVFPFLVWFSGFGRMAPKGLRNLFGVVFALSVPSLVCFVYFNRTNQPAAYFLMSSRFWELGCGCMLFLALKAGVLRPFPAKVTPTYVFAAMIAVLFAPLRFTVAATIAEVVLVALLIGSLRPETAAYDLLTLRPVAYIGRISYSLYLWHWTVLTISRWTIGIHWLSVPIQLGAMALLAASSYHFVERPVRYAEWSPVRWRSIAYGLSGSLAAAAFLVVLMKPLEGRLYLGSHLSAKTESASPDAAPDLNNWDDPKARQFSDVCNMTPQYVSGTGYKPKPVVDRTFLDKCIESPPGAPTNKILLIGDSFADISSHHLMRIAQRLGYDFRMVFGYGCPFPLAFSAITPRARERCTEVDENVLHLELIKALNAGDILVLRLFLAKSQYLSYDHGIPAPNAYDQAIADLHRAVREKGAKLMIIGANPTLNPEHVALLHAQWFNGGSFHGVGRDDNDENKFYFGNDAHLERTFAAANSYGVDFFSVTRYLCDSSDACQIRIGTHALYTDQQHLSWAAFDLFSDDLFFRMKALAVSK